MEHILIVDDEPGIRTVLHGILQSSGYPVDTADSSETALERLAARGSDGYALMLVDLQMTGRDGLSLIEQVRVSHPDMAIVILTGFATVDSAVRALREGVDDYLVKPARPDTIRAAVRRALERRLARLEKHAALARVSRDLQHLLGESPADPRTQTPASIRCGSLFLDQATHRVEWNGQPLTLTPTEFKLLAHFARNAGKVFSPQALAAAVQGYECSPLEARELIKPHLYSLRAKLETDPANPRFLVNVRGIGYTLNLT